MRDRIPLSQTDWLEAKSDLSNVSGEPGKGGRVIVRARQKDFGTSAGTARSSTGPHHAA